MTDRYSPKLIEPKWQERWRERDLFRTRADSDRRKFYYLDMYPYPSGALHMGHARNYTIGDVISRYRTMRGDNVLHPMGWDAFGLPAENAAIKNQVHPDEWTRRCIEQMKVEFGRLGFSFDWSRELASIDPEYYRWNQWFFLKLLERGLAYRKESFVNWCAQCATVLANEQVKNGACERCDTPVTKKKLEQWFYKTTAYAQQLLDDLDLVENWPERVKTMQRNWIGRSEGVQFRMKIVSGGTPDLQSESEVFTTRVDTVFGVTFVVLAPEHPQVAELTRGTEREAAVQAFVQKCLGKTEIERAAADVEKEGLCTGAFAVNPVNNEEVPIWVANYVLMEYGTGAIMAVPAHDQRDFEFAKKFDLPIRQVIQEAGGRRQEADGLAAAYLGDGTQVNSGEFDGLPNREAMPKIAEWMEQRGLGERKVQFRLRDWCLSRQRYWGTPIPIVYCDTCGAAPVPADQLPVLLPTEVEFKVGVNPLATSPTFVNTNCPKCGAAARRETDTMDTFIDSSWYFLRFASPKPGDVPFKHNEVERWLPVDQYVGGIEHATMHLIYARFFTKALRDLGLLSFGEPFARLFTQGMLNMPYFHCADCGHDSLEVRDESCAKCGSARVARATAKMSKSIGNQVTVDFVCNEYGADTGRMHALFIGPPDLGYDWPVDEVVDGQTRRLVPNLDDMEGIARFLGRVWRAVTPHAARFVPDWRERIPPLNALTAPQRELRRKAHQTMAKVTHDIDRFSFNTAIAALMEFVNRLTPFVQAAFAQPIACADDTLVFSEAAESLTLLLSPFAPHLADELWESLGKPGSTYETAWPVADETIAREDEVGIGIQVNGKMCERISVPLDLPKEALQQRALSLESVRAHLDGKTISAVHVVPNRLVNIVVA